MTLGQFIRNWRMNVLDMTMREFCLKHHIQSTRWMLIERDFAKPASFEVLTKVLAMDENSESFKELQTLYFLHEPRLMTETEMNGMMPLIHNMNKDQWLSLRTKLENQLHSAITGTHAI